ncbi:hypothetical protein RB199_39770 [Streptomyces libani]
MLDGGNTQLGEEVNTREVKGGREEIDSQLVCELGKFTVLTDAELQGFTVLAISGTEAVPARVGLVVHGLGEQRLVIALLQLRCLCTGFRGHADKFGRLL